MMGDLLGGRDGGRLPLRRFKRIKIVDAGLRLEFPHGARPLRHDAPRGRAIIFRTDRAPGFDRLDLRLHLLVVALHHVGTHIDPGEPIGVDVVDPAHDVVGLALQHEQDRAVVGVRPVAHEQIGKA